MSRLIFNGLQYDILQEDEHGILAQYYEDVWEFFPWSYVATGKCKILR